MISEARLIFIVAAIHFVNIVDAMMVMPLGPDFAHELAMPMHYIGVVSGAYTFAAAISGILIARFLDRFERRLLIAMALGGLGLSTFLAGLSGHFYELIAARVLAGITAGPATAVAMSLVIDHVEPVRRGQAVGRVMAGFSVASVVGVPIGLELASWGSWHTPFFVLSGLILLMAVISYRSLPKIKADTASRQVSLVSLLSRPGARIGLGTTLVAVAGGFLLIPNISAYIQFNLGFPREHLGWLYLIGGAFSFFTMRMAGHMADRYGRLPVIASVTLLLMVLTWLWFVDYPAGLPVVVLFAAFMVAMSARMVIISTAITLIPPPQERAGFMSLNSAIQQVGTTFGAMVSTAMLGSTADGQLQGMAYVAYVALLLMLLLPLLLYLTERRLAG